MFNDWGRRNVHPISKEQQQLLEDYGFHKSFAFYPEQIDHFDEDAPDDEFISYIYEVVCNETEQIEWLIKNNIPFVADCHYGQYTLTYDKDSPVVKVYKNLGKLALMHAFCEDKPEDEKCYEEISIEKIGDGYHI
jgi:hypothetical protein